MLKEIQKDYIALKKNITSYFPYLTRIKFMDRIIILFALNIFTYQFYNFNYLPVTLSLIYVLYQINAIYYTEHLSIMNAIHLMNIDFLVEGQKFTISFAVDFENYQIPSHKKNGYRVWSFIDNQKYVRFELHFDDIIEIKYLLLNEYRKYIDKEQYDFFVDFIKKEIIKKNKC